MKIISWNVNGIRACYKKGLLDYLQTEKADILLVQELKSFAEQCPEMHYKQTGYHDVWNSAERPGYSGVGSFFRERPKVVTAGMGDESIDKEGRVHLIDLGPVYLINSYFPNGAMSEERHQFKMRYLDLFLEWMKRLDQEKPVVLAGDLNIAHTEIDIHDPVRLDGTSGFKPEERAWMDQLMQAGFIDAFRLFFPDATNRYSWWSYRAGARQRNKGWRIDYFVCSARLDKNLKSFEMPKDVLGSDHCPMVLELEI